jgi:hypothetical protein
MNVHIPPILSPHAVFLSEFFEGMVFKLAVNAHKDDVVLKDIPILIERLIAELEEMKAEVEVEEGQRIHGDALVETFDMGNFCYLLYWFLRKQGVMDAREEFILENFVISGLNGRVFAKHNRSGSRYREGDEIVGTYRNGRCYIRVQHALTGVSVSLPRDHLVWFACKGEWPVEVRHKDGNPANDRIDNLEEVEQTGDKQFPFVAQWKPKGKEGQTHYGRWVYQRRHRGVLVRVGYWDTAEEAAREGLKEWKEKTKEMKGA